MTTKPILLFLSVALTAVAFAGCVAPAGDAEIYGTLTGGTMAPGLIKQAGSSTVLPLAEVWAEEFGNARGIAIEVSGGGSGAGASGICNGELDLGDMSRKIKDSEVNGPCAANGVDPIQWAVAYDGLSVVVSTKNQFVKDLRVDQLAHIFQGEGFATTWDEVDDTFPAEKIRLCYPDDDSGTYEYFNEAILDAGEPRKGGNDVQQSSDDNVLVTCLANDQYAVGYFGFAYVQANTGKVKPVMVEGVEPTFTSIADGSYTPLSREIYITTDGVPTGILLDYFRYVFHPEGGQRLIQDVGYVALDESKRLSNLEQLGIA